MKKSSKSSKRSKNVRSSKKTRKHLRKMRGGGGLNPGLNQAVDFIIYCDNEVLVHPNPNVTDSINNFALIGTFATASLGTNNNGKKILHSQSNNISKGHVNAKLTKLTPETALALLKKELKELNISENILSSLSPVDDIFHEVSNDKRLTEEKCIDKNTKSRNPCKIFTQLFKLKVLTGEKALFENNGCTWKNYKSDDIFSGHRNILIKVFNKLNDKPSTLSLT